MTSRSLRSFVPVRLLLHLLCAVPLVLLAIRAGSGDLGANPIEAAIRDLGDWGLRLLLVSLAVTPARRLTGFSGIARYRRMLGLWAFAYALLHLLAYVGLDQFFDWAAIGHDIVKHKFITAGMAAVVLLTPMAATSTKGMIRRLGGPRWRALHRLVYVIGPLAVLHYFWMVKADTRQPVVYALVLVALLGLRALWKAKDRLGRLPPGRPPTAG